MSTSKSKKEVNNKFNQSSTCPKCSGVLESSDAVQYCPECKECPVMMDNLQYEFNENIKKNRREYNQGNVRLKIEKHIQDITCKLNMKPSDCQIETIIQKVLWLHDKRGKKCKGYFEQAGALIFIDMEQEIRMSIQHFCNVVGMNRKKFNKMYINYKNFIRRSNLEDQSEEVEENDSNNQLKEENFLLIKEEEQKKNIKIREEAELKIKIQEQRLEQDIINQESDSMQQQRENIRKQKQGPKFTFLFKKFDQNRRPEEIIEDERSSILKTIKIIYKDIFASPYLDQYKNQVIKRIANEALKISLEERKNKPEETKMKRYFRIPTIIFCVIRNYGYKIHFSRYLRVIEQNLGVRITLSMVKSFNHFYSQFILESDQNEKKIIEDLENLQEGSGSLFKI